MMKWPGQAILIKVFLDNGINEPVSEEIIYHEFMDDKNSHWETELVSEKSVHDRLFTYFAEEHGLTLLESQIVDIINLFRGDGENCKWANT